MQGLDLSASLPDSTILMYGGILAKQRRIQLLNLEVGNFHVNLRNMGLPWKNFNPSFWKCDELCYTTLHMGWCQAHRQHSLVATLQTRYRKMWMPATGVYIQQTRYGRHHLLLLSHFLGGHLQLYKNNMHSNHIIMFTTECMKKGSK